jgi:hypothetical protein
VNDAFRNSLVIEMKDFLAKVKILQQGRPARTDLERVLVVRNRSPLRRGQHRYVASRDLMQFTAFAAVQLLVVDGRGLAARALR